MAYYNTCPHCGSNLDLGERCECVRERERRRIELGDILAIGNTKEFCWQDKGSLV